MDTGRLLLFDPVRRELIASIRGHLNAAFCVAFSPDGRRLISSSGSREAIKVWDVTTRQELLTLPDAGSSLPQAAWGPDGNDIVTRPPVQVWHASSWEEIAVAETKEKAQGTKP